MDLNYAIVKIDAMCSSVNLVEPHLTPDAARLDAITGEHLIHKLVWTTDSQSVLRVGVKSILCGRAMSTLSEMVHMIAR